LPANHSRAGEAIDGLFTLIFWITLTVFIGVHIALVWFLFRYRHRADRSTARFVHGHTRVELAWTLLTTFILMALALISMRVWDGYERPAATGLQPVRVMVIGQQFKWNVIYPGPDGVVGRYLTYPKPTDARWPNGVRFQGVVGPAALPSDKAVAAVNAYVEQVNPLGKDFADPAGADDDWENALARDLVVPVDRPVEVLLGSRDVIHDLGIPVLRVKMDAVPGRLGTIRFTATRTSDVSASGYFDIVCQELCGSGHYTMTGRLRVVSEAEWLATSRGLQPAGLPDPTSTTSTFLPQDQSALRSLSRTSGEVR
jgi:cytochrome c oxidase subunit 2